MKLVVLDRDGTLNAETERFIRRPQDWQPLPGAMDAVARLNQAGYTVVLAANVPGLGRGLIDMAALLAVHARMHKALADAGGRIDSVFFCPHVPEDLCDCRKPKPGLLLQIAERYGVSPSQIEAVGNSASDVQAARAAGCRVHLVLTGGARPEQAHPLPPEFGPDVQVHADVMALAQALVSQKAAPVPQPSSVPHAPFASQPLVGAPEPGAPHV